MIEDFLDNPQVTWAAKGIMLWLASRPQDEQIRIQDIIDAGPTGRDQVLNTLNELETAGFLRRVQDTVAGRFQPLRYEINFAPDSTAFTQYVYLVRADDIYKIGMSRTPKARIRAIGNVMGAPVEIIHIIDTDDMIRLEEFLHRRYDATWVQGEWFRLSDADVEWIKTLRSVTVSTLIEEQGHE